MKVTKASDIIRQWHLFNAENQILGKLATRAAKLLMGKHKPTYTPNLDTGDYVVVINAAKIKVTGDKLNQKTYYRHSGYPGGLKHITLGDVLKTKPERAIEYAVRGMLPTNRLGDAMIKKLHVYPGESHPHSQLKGKAEKDASAGEKKI